MKTAPIYRLRKPPVTPAVIRERPMFAEGSGFNLADYDRVIAARIDPYHDAFQTRGRVVEQWRSGYAGPVAYVAEAILIFGSKSPGEVFLIFRENIDREVCAF
jgi:hypothetical protein